jgi:hypothetical protein
MAGSFTFGKIINHHYHHLLLLTTILYIIVSKPGKKISLERTSHPCPKCKHHASVQLIRSERQWIVFNKCVSSIMRVRYECSRCNWKNEELPFDTNDDMKLAESRLIQYMPTTKTSASPVY